MAYVVFISEQRLKSITAVHDNVEPDDITPFVVQAQDIYVQDMLGTKFYNSLKDAVVGASLTTPETTLIDDYLSPMIANYAIYLALPSLNFKIKNKAVLTPTSEESTSNGLEEIKYLRQSVLDTAQFYGQRTLEYLNDYSSDFPDYTNPGDKGMNPSHRSPYEAGIFIPSSYYCPGDDNEIILREG